MYVQYSYLCAAYMILVFKEERHVSDQLHGCIHASYFEYPKNFISVIISVYYILLLYLVIKLYIILLYFYYSKYTAQYDGMAQEFDYPAAEVIKVFKEFVIRQMSRYPWLRI